MSQMNKQVTRNIDPASAQDLLERVPRACLSFAGDRGPEAWPVVLLWRDGRYLIHFQQSAGCPPAAGQEAVLLVDEGGHYFDLRAIYIRGQVRPAEAPPGAPFKRAWYELVPLKTVAWDYGQMREVSGER